MKERVKKTQERYSKESDPQDMKICPFSSSAAGIIYCTPRCALYRSGKQKGYECPFTELTSMSWFIKGQPGRPRK
jgi:hypothetical protein